MHVLAALTHPRISFLAATADPMLFERAADAATQLFTGMYGDADGSSNSARFDPLAQFGSATAAGGYKATSLAGSKALHAAFLEDSNFSTSSQRSAVNEYEWFSNSCAAAHVVLHAAHRATCSPQATSADPERTNCFGSRTWSKFRRNLSAESGSRAVVVAMQERAAQRHSKAAPTLPDIPYMCEIIHNLEAQLVDDKLEKVLTILGEPPRRQVSKTESTIIQHAGRIAADSVAATLSAISFQYDELEEPEAGELLEALDSAAFVADDNWLSIMPVSLVSALDESESSVVAQCTTLNVDAVVEDDKENNTVQNDTDDFFVQPTTKATLAEMAYGRIGYRSMRLALRAAAAEKEEELRSAAAAAAAADVAASTLESAATQTAAAAADPEARKVKRTRATQPTNSSAANLKAAAVASSPAEVQVDDSDANNNVSDLAL